MPREDWLFDGGRRATATERIYAAATELIYRDGIDAFNVDALAAATHCSRATIYRYVGGKKDIREAVLARAATRITEIVRASVEGRTGPDRVVTAIEVAVVKSAPIPRARCSWIRPAAVGGIG
jgi:AcrR family transcriptional regulator